MTKSGPTGFIHFADIAVAVCEGPINAIRRIWADGKLIYDDGVLGGGTPQVGPSTLLQGIQSLDWFLVQSQSGGPDLTLFPSGTSVTMGGWSEAANNGIWTVDHTDRDSTTGISRLWFWTGPGGHADGVNDPAGDSVTITGETVALAANAANDITIYLGDETQAADPIIELSHLPNTIPGFRGTAYVVFTQFHLSKFGNRIPHLTFHVEAQGSLSVAQAITNLLVRGGLSPDDFDVSGVTGELIGYTVESVTSPAIIIQNIMGAFNISVRESNKRLIFFDSEDSPTLNIAAASLGAYEEGTEPTSILTLSDTPEFELATSVDVSFPDHNNNFETGSQQERLINTNFRIHRNLRTPVVMTAIDARNMARRLLWDEWGRRRVGEFSASSVHQDLEEGDLVTVTDNAGESFVIRLTEINRGNNFVIEARGVIERDGTVDAGLVVDPGAVPEPAPPYIPPEITLLIMDIPPLRSEDVEIPGYYFALAASDIDAQWGGSTLYQSFDDLTYQTLTSVQSEAKIAMAETILPVGIVGHWDRISTLDITMLHGALSSRTEEEVLGGLNRMRIGGEIIGFQVADLIAPNKYRLSTLIRGLRNSEDKVDNHAVNEFAVLLEPVSVNFKSIIPGAIGTDRWWKPVAEGGDISAVVKTTRTLRGRTLMEFSPAHMTAVRESNDILFHWVRRSRGIHRLLSPLGSPLIPPFERYEIDILDPAALFAVRTVLVDMATDFSASLLSSSATATAFKKISGSWHEEGALQGDTLTVITGANAGTHIIERVEALTLTIVGGLTVEAVGAVMSIPNPTPRFVYTAAQQTADGFTPGAVVTLAAYQMNEPIGRGWPAFHVGL